MPYLKIQVNKNLNTEEEIIQKASKLIAEELGKPESYVMVLFEPEVKLAFGGSMEPAVFMELKSIGLDDTKTEGLSRTLCNFSEKELGVSKDRVYIEFKDASGSMWGWNGSTFS